MQLHGLCGCITLGITRLNMRAMSAYLLVDNTNPPFPLATKLTRCGREVCRHSALPTPDHGSWPPVGPCDGVFANSKCQVNCDAGYAGYAYATCKSDGTWSTVTGTCYPGEGHIYKCCGRDDGAPSISSQGLHVSRAGVHVGSSHSPPWLDATMLPTDGLTPTQTPLLAPFVLSVGLTPPSLPSRSLPGERAPQPSCQQRLAHRHPVRRRRRRDDMPRHLQSGLHGRANGHLPGQPHLDCGDWSVHRWYGGLVH